MVDAHTVATYAFAQLRRDPSFNERLPWVRDTVVCVESDLCDDVFFGQVGQYFPRGATIACYYPTDQRFRFVLVKAPPPGAKPGDSGDDAIVAVDKEKALTVGMMVDAIHRDKNGDLSHLPLFGQRKAIMAEESTAVIEKSLTLLA